MKIKTLSLIILVITLAFKADKPAYRIFNEKGKEVKYKELVTDAMKADIILFGELHNNPISHWLQLELTKDVYGEKQDHLILGAEMFESDNALILSEYVSKQIPKKNFEREARLWPNYKTDYKPLVEFAHEKNIPFIATNIPRRYAAIVYKGGFEELEGLNDEAKALMAPLPINYDPELSCYKQMLEMGGMGAHVTENLPKAQAMKDATMAHFILKNWKQGDTFIHYNGSYHSDNFESIVWYLLEANPNLKIMTIATTQQPSIEELNEESVGVANFVICVPESMTKTH
ncbi:MAG: ChaN family lipoprotein [Bacteroidales bacterium]|nr:ChaN family lipoprotein [Bacteroidales bacterium]